MLLFSMKNKTNGKTLKNPNSESLKVDLKLHKGKTKYMTKHADSEDILTDQEKNGKSDRIQISWTNHIPQRHYKRRNLCQDQSSVELFWKKKTRTNPKKKKQLPTLLKNK